MDSEREIYGIAKVYLREHGEDAVIEAAMRADELLSAGDMDGRWVWLRVIEAIKALSATSPSVGSTWH
jgi:hypothetical protein